MKYISSQGTGLGLGAEEEEKQTRERDVISLLIDGYNADQASYILNIPVSEVARIEEDNQRRRKFLMTGDSGLARTNGRGKYTPMIKKEKKGNYLITSFFFQRSSEYLSMSDLLM